MGLALGLGRGVGRLRVGGPTSKDAQRIGAAERSSATEGLLAAAARTAASQSAATAFGRSARQQRCRGPISAQLLTSHRCLKTVGEEEVLLSTIRRGSRCRHRRTERKQPSGNTTANSDGCRLIRGLSCSANDDERGAGPMVVAVDVRGRGRFSADKASALRRNSGDAREFRMAPLAANDATNGHRSRLLLPRHR